MAQAQEFDRETQSLKTCNTNLQLVDIPLDGDQNLTLLCDIQYLKATPAGCGGCCSSRNILISSRICPGPGLEQLEILPGNVLRGMCQIEISIDGRKLVCPASNPRFRDTSRLTYRNATFQISVSRTFTSISLGHSSNLTGFHICLLVLLVEGSYWWVDKTTQSCVRALMTGWILRFGVPRHRQLKATLMARCHGPH